MRPTQTPAALPDVRLQVHPPDHLTHTRSDTPGDSHDLDLVQFYRPAPPAPGRAAPQMLHLEPARLQHQAQFRGQVTFLARVHLAVAARVFDRHDVSLDQCQRVELTELDVILGEVAYLLQTVRRGENERRPRPERGMNHAQDGRVVREW